MAAPKLLLTNDDGIDSVGLHRLAEVMQEIGEVTIVAPDAEYSGASASIGPLHLGGSIARRATVPSGQTAWTVNGPPGLCVLFARMGAFDFTPDLVVSGINPGANMGRAVYHSGTVGAALTGRNGNVPGIAVSQAFASFPELDPDDPPSEEELRAMYAAVIEKQNWDSAAAVAVEVVSGMLEDLPPDCGVLNLNVPNLPVEEMNGFRWTSINNPTYTKNCLLYTSPSPRDS